MNFIYRPAVLILLLGVAFLASACSTPGQPLAPDRMLGQKRAWDSSPEAKAFSENVAAEMQKNNPPSAPIETPPKIKNISEIKDPAWKAIRAKKVDTSRPLALIELLDMALRNNPKTRQAWENTRVARAKEKQSESKLYPQVNVSETITREKSDANIPGNDIDDYYYGPTAKLTYLLFNFGGRGFAIKETVEMVLSADAQYDQAIQDLVLGVEQSYYGLYSSQAALQAAQDDTKNAKDDYDAAQEKFAVGLTSKLDALQAQSNYQDSLYKLEQAKGGLESAKASLAQVIGVAADTAFEIAEPSDNLPAGVTKEDASLLIEESLEKRPDIAGLKAEWRSKKAAAHAATTDLLPSLSLGGQASKNNYKYYGVHKASEEDHGYAGYAQVSWNVFDGFYNLNKKRQADRERDIAFERLIEGELALSADVWTKYYSFSTAQNKLVFSESFLASAQESYDLALESYKAGLKSMLDLTQAQAQLSQARSRLIQSRQDVFVALAQLAHSTGTLSVKDYGFKINNMDTEEGKDNDR